MSIVKRSALFLGALLVVSLVAAVGPADAGIPPTTGPATATLTVTKVVQGTAPADAEFVIEVDCETAGTTELTYGATGGSQDVIFFEEDACTITETSTGGAVDVTPPIDIDILSPTLYEATVTNVFDTAPSSETTASAQAAAATRPTFTG